MRDDDDSANEAVLDLFLLSAGLPALTPAGGQALAEQAAVCFDAAGHSSGEAALAVRGYVEASWRLRWPAATEQMRRAYRDIPEATEQGAYGVAILIVRTITGLTVVERSVKGTGFDYWLGEDMGHPFQNKARLEVSGILQGTASQINARLKQKETQTRVSDKFRLPAYIVVVEYGGPNARVSKR